MLPKNTVDLYLHLKKRLDKVWQWFLIFWVLQFLLTICLGVIGSVAFAFVFYNPHVVLTLLIIMFIIICIFAIVQEPKNYCFQALERIKKEIEEMEHQRP